MKTHSLVIAFFILFSFTASAQSNFIGSGISLAVNGENGNYLELGDVYNDLNFPFTIEAWVYPTAWTAFGDYAPIISTDNSSVGSYYGLWFRFNSAGKLILEIGDGSGSGSTDRRGKVTANAVSLNHWTHVAVVATSVTDIKFYFNGVLQTSSSTDGGASNTSLVHNSNPASIGRQITPFNEHNFIGQLDEVRLWTNSKTVDEIRTNMCSKIAAIPDGLIGYWNFDESYDSETSVDLTSPAEDGTIEGSADKITSGAPIGDESVNAYNDDWTSVKLILTSPGGDKFNLNKILNNPYGVQLYRVDSNPFFTEGLSSSTGYYYGVFTANSAAAAKYNISYKYSFANGVVSPDNETDARVFVKTDDASSPWNDLVALPNYPDNSLISKNISTRNEFIFNVNEVIGGRSCAINNKLKLTSFPNPASDFIIIANVSENDRIIILGINGDILLEQSVISNCNNYNIDISQFPCGLYILNLISNQTAQTIKFVKSN